jgi:ADP-ribosyl-[dinitrogen reductase] hydrolase
LVPHSKKPLSTWQHIVREGYVTHDAVANGERLHLEPLAHSDFLLDKFAGTLFGCAIGDALGRSVEGYLPGTTSVENYSPWRGWQSGPVGTITDDTQMTMWLGSHLIRNGTIAPAELAEDFTNESIRGIGRATLTFVINFKDAGLPWYRAGVSSAGNGTAMRASPIGLFYSNDEENLRAAGAIQAMVTHNDIMAMTASVTMALAVSMLLRMQPEELESTEERCLFLVRLAKAIEGMELEPYPTRNQRPPSTLYKRIGSDLPQYLHQGATVSFVQNELWSGAYVLESLPFALYCFLMHPMDFKTTLLSSTNGSKDSDTVAAMSCALSGALNGRTALSTCDDGYYMKNLEFAEDIENISTRIYNMVIE